MSENNISLCQYVDMSECQYVRMSICQKATFQLRYENGSCSKYHIVQNGIRMLERHYVTMSICQYVNMSICQYVKMQLFSLGIKTKVVQNVKII